MLNDNDQSWSEAAILMDREANHRCVNAAH